MRMEIYTPLGIYNFPFKSKRINLKPQNQSYNKRNVQPGAPFTNKD